MLCIKYQYCCVPHFLITFKLYSADCTLIENSDSGHDGQLDRSGGVEDTGTHTTTVNSILNVFDDQDQLAQGVSCPLDITLTRTNQDTLDPENAFGRIQATHGQVVTVSVTP